MIPSAATATARPGIANDPVEKRQGDTQRPPRTLVPGDHRPVTRHHVFPLPLTKAMHSGDGDYHLCLFPNEDTPRCFTRPKWAIETAPCAASSFRIQFRKALIFGTLRRFSG